MTLPQIQNIARSSSNTTTIRSATLPADTNTKDTSLITTGAAHSGSIDSAQVFNSLGFGAAGQTPVFGNIGNGASAHTTSNPNAAIEQQQQMQQMQQSYQAQSMAQGMMASGLQSMAQGIAREAHREINKSDNAWKASGSKDRGGEDQRAMEHFTDRISEGHFEEVKPGLTTLMGEENVKAMEPVVDAILKIK